jgi:tetratricopeptide (TPR) repeat protein
MGEVYRLNGDYAAAAAAYHRGRDVQEGLRERHPDRPEYRHDLSRTHYNLGIVARQAGHPDEAVTELTAARQFLDGAPADDAVQRRHRARISLNLAPALRAKGRLAEAEAECREAIRLFDALIDKDRDRYDFQFERAAARINLGLVRRQARDPAGAKAELTRARDQLEALTGGFWAVPLYRAELARAYNALAALAFEANDLPEAAALFGRSADVWADLSVGNRDNPEYRGELGIALGNQGIALERCDPEKARKGLERGVMELLTALRANPTVADFRNALGDQAPVLGELLAQAGQHDRARQLAGEMATALPDRVAGAHRAVALLAGCVRRGGPAAEAENRRHEARAIELVKAAGPADWSALAADPDCQPLVDRPAFAAALGR